MDDVQTISWLRCLAARGGKGAVDNIDARSLGRIADRLEELVALAAAQREKDAKTLEDLASAGAKFGLRPNATLLEAAAAIRSQE